MSKPVEHNGVELFLGEFVSMDARIEDRLGKETFHWFIVRRKNDYPVTARGQYVRAESDGTISVVVDDAEQCHTVAQFRPEEVEGVFEGDTPVVIKKPA